MGIGVFHCFCGLKVLPAFSRPASAMLADGVVNATLGQMDRIASCWFQLGGLCMLHIGWLFNRYESDTGHVLPASAGWSLLLINAVGATLMPKGGFWLFILPCALIVARDRAQSR